MVEKIFKGYVILNWKNGQFRVMKTKPKKTLKPSEIPVELNLKVEIPETPYIVANADIKLGGDKVKRMIVETLEEGTSIEESK